MNPRLCLGSIFFTLSSDFFLHILKSYSNIVQYLLIQSTKFIKHSDFSFFLLFDMIKVSSVGRRAAGGDDVFDVDKCFWLQHSN